MKVTEDKSSGKSWYENQQAKQGNSCKAKLQFNIDRTLKQSTDWDDFFNSMTKLGYEIKYGKHIAFRHKDNQRLLEKITLKLD